MGTDRTVEADWMIDAEVGDERSVAGNEPHSGLLPVELWAMSLCL